jgi:cysteine desulfuration protein SufE
MQEKIQQEMQQEMQKGMNDDKDIFASCLEKQKMLLDQFRGCETSDERYQKIIELGRKQAKLSQEQKKEENLVPGCQSRLYVHSSLQNGKVYFESESDALISAGLAALLILVYSAETPEVILKCPPEHLGALKLHEMLTPSRSNGLAAVYRRIKQDALRYVLEIQKSNIGN